MKKFIQQEASKGNVLAKQYLEKLRKEEVSIDWAHRVLINSIRHQRMLKMMTIAGDRHFSYENEIELVQFIASEMQKEVYNETCHLATKATITREWTERTSKKIPKHGLVKHFLNY